MRLTAWFEDAAQIHKNSCLGRNSERTLLRVFLCIAQQRLGVSHLDVTPLLLQAPRKSEIFTLYSFVLLQGKYEKLFLCDDMQ